MTKQEDRFEVELPEPDGYIMDSLPGGRMEYKRGGLGTSDAITCSSAPVFEHHTVRALLGKANAKVETLKSELVKESARTAEQKLRADQMTKQHDMACKRNKGVIPAGYALVPIEGDLLPVLGSRVYIRHARDDLAHACYSRALAFSAESTT